MTEGSLRSPGSTWPIQPHTGAKLRILKSYLNAWFPILARGHFPRIVYIDGFSGPGNYSGGEDGSPLVALKAVLDQKLRLDSAFEFHLVEFNRQYLARLRHEIQLLQSALDGHKNLIVTVYEEQAFADAYQKIKQRLGSYGETVPTFALLDPFGWTGAPFAIVRDLLARPSTEVAINFMHEEISRFLGQGQQPDNFDALFGCRKWREALPLKGYERTYRLHDLYRDQLINGATARYVRSFTMVNKRNRVDYFLFFATRSLLGFRKMKEAMWRVDPAEGSQFSDATNPNAPSLFDRNPNLASLRSMLMRQFGNSWTMVDTLIAFAVTDTPFLPSHVKQMLGEGERAQPPAIDVQAAGTRRRGTFPEARGIQVRFR